MRRVSHGRAKQVPFSSASFPVLPALVPRRLQQLYSGPLQHLARRPRTLLRFTALPAPQRTTYDYRFCHHAMPSACCLQSAFCSRTPTSRHIRRLPASFVIAALSSPAPALTCHISRSHTVHYILRLTPLRYLAGAAGAASKRDKVARFVNIRWVDGAIWHMLERCSNASCDDLFNNICHGRCIRLLRNTGSMSGSGAATNIAEEQLGGMPLEMLAHSRATRITITRGGELGAPLASRTARAVAVALSRRLITMLLRCALNGASHQIRQA